MNSNKVSLNRPLLLPVMAALSFFLFICWIIVMADKGEKIWLMSFVRSFDYGDKLGHFILYGILTLLVNLALRQKMVRIFSYPVLLGSVLVATFAILEEFTQLGLQTRTFELLDILCDLAGIVFFSYFPWVKQRAGRF